MKDRNEKREEIVRHLVTTVANEANIKEKEVIEREINTISKMKDQEAIDYILITLNRFYERKILTEEQIFSNAEDILSLSTEEYKTIDDLLNRLFWLKSRNFDHQNTSLRENHELVIETFDKLNGLIENNFDCFYTGGLMGYIATNQRLERFHGDLDLFINENELLELKKVVDESSEFTFKSSLKKKGKTGHEFEIVCKNKPMSIGLFLFEREFDDSVTLKSYYYENDKLLVQERHYDKDYTKIAFPKVPRTYHNHCYQMMRLEAIYNSKKRGRIKDKYDAKKIEPYIDKELEKQLDLAPENQVIQTKTVNKSIVLEIEGMLQGKKRQTKREEEHSRKKL